MNGLYTSEPYTFNKKKVLYKGEFTFAASNESKAEQLVEILNKAYIKGAKDMADVALHTVAITKQEIIDEGMEMLNDLLK
jgi:hypothetical protein